MAGLLPYSGVSRVGSPRSRLSGLLNTTRQVATALGLGRDADVLAEEALDASAAAAVVASASFVLGGALAVPAGAATPAGAGTAPAVQRPADAVETYGNMATGSCLDDSQFGLRTIRCNGGLHQTWR